MSFTEALSLSIRTVNAEEDTEAVAESWYLPYMEDEEDEASLDDSTLVTWLLILLVVMVVLVDADSILRKRRSGGLHEDNRQWY
jgi:hypothetical protein